MKDFCDLREEVVVQEQENRLGIGGMGRPKVEREKGGETEASQYHVWLECGWFVGSSVDVGCCQLGWCASQYRGW